MSWTPATEEDEGSAPPDAPRAKWTLTELLEKESGAFLDAIAGKIQPIYTGDQVPEDILWAARRSKKAPFPRQVHAAAAIWSGLRGPSLRVKLKGEMGVGKTLISILAAEAYARTLKRPLRIYVTCPTHLVKKWRREILRAAPVVDVRTPRTLTEIDALFTSPIHRNTYLVVSKERAKLGCQRRHAFLQSRCLEALYPGARYFCSSCFRPITEEDRDDMPESGDVERSYLRAPKDTRYYRCEHCGSPAYTYTALPQGGRRHPLADYLLRKGYIIDLLLADEFHEYKGGGSAQGIALDWLTQASRAGVYLTGTLCNGYASSLFYLLYRTKPEIRARYGFNDERRWVDQYGFLEHVTFAGEDEEGRQSRRKSKREIIRETPGLSPTVFTHLLGDTVFLSMRELEQYLPPYDERAVPIEPSKAQRDGYAKLERYYVSHGRRMDPRARSQMVQALLSWIDRPFEDEVIRNRKDEIVTGVPAIRLQKAYPKEEKLLEIVRGERGEGRKVLVYCTHTGTRDIQVRLKEILEKAGHRTEILWARSPKAEAREEWIERMAPRIDILITNPRNVRTGLDLIQFPTFVYMEPDNDLFVLMQSCRRSWRIGQDKPVRVHYLFYQNTMQHRAAGAMARKVRTHLMVQGESIPTGSLADFGETDMLAQIASDLIRNAPLPDVNDILRGNKALEEMQREKDPEGEVLIFRGRKKEEAAAPPPADGRATTGDQIGLFGDDTDFVGSHVKIAA